MYPKGTVFVSGGRKKHSEVNLRAPLLTRFIYGLMQGIGAGLIGFAVIVTVFTFGPLVKEEFLFTFGLVGQKQAAKNGFGELLNRVSAESTSKVQEEASSLNLDSYFSVYIPKIDAKARVIANVDTGNEQEYDEALMKGVGHAKGTYFPGQGKNIFLFAHSTDSPINFARYNAVFYLLGKLEKGDKITVFFTDKKYEYKVSDKVTVGATDTKWLMNPPVEGETLILQTCYPPGTTWSRLLIVAKPVDK